MSKLTDILATVGVHNPHGIYNGDTPAGQVYISYHPEATGMLAMSAYWTVTRVGYKTDPNAGWPDYKHKRFSVEHQEGSHAERKAAALAAAQKWAGERYGITDWQRDPFGSYGDAAFITARVTELKAQATQEATA